MDELGGGRPDDQLDYALDLAFDEVGNAPALVEEVRDLGAGALDEFGILDRFQVDARVVGRTLHPREGDQGADSGVGNHDVVAAARGQQAQFQCRAALPGGLHRDLGGVPVAGLERLAARGLLVRRVLRHAQGVHDAVEGLRVRVHRGQQEVLDALRPGGKRVQFLVAAGKLGLAGREVRDHRGQRRADRARQRGDRTAARSWRVARDLVDELADRLADQVTGGAGQAQYLLLRFEWRDVAQAHGLHRGFDHVANGEPGGLAHATQVVAAGFQHCVERDHADDLGTGDGNAALRGLLPRGLQDRMGRRHLEIGQVDGDLRATVLVDHPADRLDVREAAVRVHGPSLDRLCRVVECGVAGGQVPAVGVAVMRRERVP